MIRALRLARRLSQEELAHRAEVSTRHLSCLEGGRARPSHTMILVLGSALDLPLRERNTLLVAAGFAPVYRISLLEDPAMAHVHQAVSHLLRHHEPHPAILMDRAWNVLQLNAGAQRLFRWCGVTLSASAPANAHRILFDPALGLRPWIVNFDAVADAMLERLRTEVDVDPSLHALLIDLERLRGKTRPRPGAPTANLVALPIHIRRENEDLRYFTTLTTLGTPLDVTAQELRIESFFPMDEATSAFAHRLSSEVGG
jgi:transcriptional regulator with XRE-family HTH domain